MTDQQGPVREPGTDPLLEAEIGEGFPEEVECEVDSDGFRIPQKSKSVLCVFVHVCV